MRVRMRVRVRVGVRVRVRVRARARERVRVRARVGVEDRTKQVGARLGGGKDGLGRAQPTDLAQGHC